MGERSEVRNAKSAILSAIVLVRPHPQPTTLSLPSTLSTHYLSTLYPLPSLPTTSLSTTLSIHYLPTLSTSAIVLVRAPRPNFSP